MTAFLAILCTPAACVCLLELGRHLLLLTIDFRIAPHGIELAALKRKLRRLSGKKEAGHEE